MSACVGEQSRCAQRYAGRFGGIGCQQAMTRPTSSAPASSVSRARLNDTPKMAALLLVLPALARGGVSWRVAVAIAVGGLLSARRVAETMSHKITG